EELLSRRSRSRRAINLSEESNKVLALLVRQLFLASRDWSLARRIGSPDPRQLLEWRVVVHTLEEVANLLAEISAELNRDPSHLGSGGPEIRALLGELKVSLKSVMETLMRPSVTLACDGHAESLRLAESAHATSAHMKGDARRNGLQAAGYAVSRAARALAQLSQVALDRAVAQGGETIIVAAP
ncbi:MAG: hypothetical protein L3K17_02990, partial [Thermoplasmata archaeon]|nr:hypothetical protein [Thermoplasmata archaeon]